MTIGVILTDDDLKAVQKLYSTRWAADIRNWKERGEDSCLWIVTCPNKANEYIIETGQSLTDTIERLLKRV